MNYSCWNLYFVSSSYLFLRLDIPHAHSDPRHAATIVSVYFRHCESSDGLRRQSLVATTSHHGRGRGGGARAVYAHHSLQVAPASASVLRLTFCSSNHVAVSCVSLPSGRIMRVLRLCVRTASIDHVARLEASMRPQLVFVCLMHSECIDLSDLSAICRSTRPRVSDVSLL